MAKTDVPRTNFDGITDPVNAPASLDNIKTPPLWGSARLTYTICAFFAMVVQLCLRNTLNFVILCMVKPQHVDADNSTDYKATAEDGSSHSCGPIDSGNDTSIERVS